MTVNIFQTQATNIDGRNTIYLEIMKYNILFGTNKISVKGKIVMCVL